MKQEKNPENRLEIHFNCWWETVQSSNTHIAHLHVQHIHVKHAKAPICVRWSGVVWRWVGAWFRFGIDSYVLQKRTNCIYCFLYVTRENYRLDWTTRAKSETAKRFRSLGEYSLYSIYWLEMKRMAPSEYIHVCCWAF